MASGGASTTPRDNSRRFEDQVLSSADPAVQAGKRVIDYLASCPAEEFYDLWGWAYQGDNGQGMRVVDQDGVAVMEDFSSNVSAHINKLAPDALSPDGYELPTMEEFQPGLRRYGLHLDDVGRYAYAPGTLGGSLPGEPDAAAAQRPGGGDAGADRPDQHPDVEYRFPVRRGGVTWYGPGAQWNSDGIKHSGHYNNILFAVYSPQGSGWYMNGGMGNLYMTKNGAGDEGYAHPAFQEVARGVYLRHSGGTLASGSGGLVALCPAFAGGGDSFATITPFCVINLSKEDNLLFVAAVCAQSFLIFVSENEKR